MRGPLLLEVAATILLLASGLFGRAIRVLDGDPRAWLREHAILLSLLAVGTGARLFVPLAPINWYSAIGYGAPISAGLDVLVSSLHGVLPAVAPFDLTAGMVFLAGLGCVWQSHGLVAGMGGSRRLALTTAGCFALAPIAIRLGTSDAPHVIALFLWLTAARAGQGASRLNRGEIATAWACSLTMPLMRTEAALWAPALIALWPLTRRSRLREWLAAGVAAALPLAAAVLMYRDRSGDPTAPDLSLVRFLQAPVGMWDGLFSTAVAVKLNVPWMAPLYHWTGAVILAAGSLSMLAFNRTLLVRILLAMTLLFAPDAVYDKSPDTQMTLRYSLPCLFLAFVLLGACADPLQRLLGARRGWACYLAPLLALGGGQAWLVLPASHQFSFRQEFRFLKRELARMPPGTRVCMIGPHANHAWAGRHLDLDTSYDPGVVSGDGATVGGWYMGSPAELREWLPPACFPSGCDYYYESSVCHLSERTSPGASPALAADAGLFRSYCGQAMGHWRLEKMASEAIGGVTISQVDFESSEIQAALYRVEGTGPSDGRP